MNDTEATVMEQVARHLRDRGLLVVVKDARREERIDAWLRVTKDKRHVDYAVEVKQQVTPQTLGAVVTQLEQWGKLTKKPPLLAAPYITPPVGDRLMALKQQFVDAAGNAYLDAPGMFVLITGRKPDKTTLPEKPVDAFTAASLKTLFAFICKPALAAAPYREIAVAANVSLGVLPGVLAGLQQAEHLYIMGNSRKLIATRRLLDAWSLAYASKLRPKQLMRTLVTPAFASWRKWDLQADRAAWGGEPAAALLTKHLEPGVLTLYAGKPPARLMVEHRMSTASHGTDHNLVEIRKPFWGDIAWHEKPWVTVPPALVYADLLATGDARCIESAQMIYEDILARSFPAR
ncbi:type IV toxin-antitoxin system AbiEi family antitoxin [Steroidobacter agaridevorans]|uniref:type IV toxin-antitoxin system AbiEi family antitoxin n=1 Tax=Steroidobacter agaridevorans TaxID=2695856 RepID=UPI00137A1A78|nr:type IV toxin-antitoxin system AbiEi family antitoxin [Steroidobacter agaridevorans]